MRIKLILPVAASLLALTGTFAAKINAKNAFVAPFGQYTNHCSSGVITTTNACNGNGAACHVTISGITGTFPAFNSEDTDGTTCVGPKLRK